MLGANAVSQVGDMMVAVALPWFVLETTGSVLSMGFTGAVIGLGTMASAVAGGPLVDRVGLRRASIVSDVTAGAGVAAVPLIYLAGALAFWQFLALVFLVSVLNSPGDLARRALVPTLAAWAEMPLERANAADTAIPRVAQLAGPVLGGVLVAVAGAANVMLLNSATFFLSAALVAVGVPAAAGARAATGRQGPQNHQLFGNPGLLLSHARRYASDLAQGLRFVVTSGLVVSLTVVATVANLLEKPLMSVVAPAYAESVYGSAASFGALLGAFGAGAVVGTVLMGVVGHRLPHRRTFLTCLLVAPLILFGALAVAPPLPVALVSVAVSGVAFGPMNTLFATAVQEATPPELLGRVIGAITAVSMVGIPVGAIVAGLVVENAGLVPTLLGMGAIYLLLAVGMAVNPALRQMDGPRATTAP